VAGGHAETSAAATSEEKYHLPNMGHLSLRLDGCTVFSKLDLQKWYYQVPVAAADVPKTAVITLFEFVRMPFGLKNAGMTFKRFIDKFLLFTILFCLSGKPVDCQLWQ
jgi:hypothetical protein